jgi:S1-C subfamily serine protease
MGLANWSKGLQSRFGFESKGGVVITEVAPDGAADRAGLKPGDVILKIDGKKIDSVDQLRRESRGKDHVLVWIERQGEYYFQKLRS